jgi:hypothetical protein
VEDDFKHWLTPKIRVAIYGFFMKHLGVAGEPTEVDVELLTEDQLRISSTGQVSTSLGGQMIFDINRKETERLYESIQASRKTLVNISNMFD